MARRSAADVKAARAKINERVVDTPAGPTGFVASAATVARDKIRRPGQGGQQGWQADLWDLYDEVGEFRYAQNWLAHSASRAELDVEKQDPVSGTWTSCDPTDPGRIYMDEVWDSCGGQAEYVRTTALHLGVPGESWTVGRELVDEITGLITGYTWCAVNGEEFERTGDKLTMTDPDTDEPVEITEDAMIVRVWRPHPRKRRLADSPSKAVRQSLREILNVSKHIAATVDSRLAGNGVLILPKEVSITDVNGVTSTTSPSDDPSKDPVMAVLTQVLTSTIGDRDSAAAVVPIILRMAGEYIEKVRHVTFGTEFDAQAIPIRSDAIKRTALGLDMPPEQLLGMGDSNHWGAWQIEESAVKVVIEPVLRLIVDALTLQLLRPLLTAAGIAGTYRIVYNVEKLIQRPNRSAEADAAFDRKTIGIKAYRLAKGFDPDDAPTDLELRYMLLIDLVKAGHIDPFTASQLGIPANTTAGTPDPAAALPAGEGTDSPTPEVEDTTTGAPGVAAAGAPDQLATARRMLMLRAIEFAGFRLRKRGTSYELANIPLYDTHLTLTVDEAEARRALSGGFTLADAMLVDDVPDPGRRADVIRQLEDDAVQILTTRTPVTEWTP